MHIIAFFLYLVFFLKLSSSYAVITNTLKMLKCNGFIAFFRRNVSFFSPLKVQYWMLLFRWLCNIFFNSALLYFALKRRETRLKWWLLACCIGFESWSHPKSIRHDFRRHHGIKIYALIQDGVGENELFIWEMVIFKIVPFSNRHATRNVRQEINPKWWDHWKFFKSEGFELKINEFLILHS